MITKVLVFVSAFLLVSAEDGFGISSASLHIPTAPKNVAFTEIGQYTGETENKVVYSKTYYLSTHFQATWIQAKTFCKAFDLELATFETSHEAEYFLNKAAEIDYYADYEDFRHALVDGITSTPKSLTDWYWSNSGEKIPYSIQWANGEPNNPVELCMSIGRTNKYKKIGFNDYRCGSEPTHFICQKTVRTA